MAARGIYPNLRKFCEENNIDLCSELDIIYSTVPQDDLSRKVPKLDNPNNLNAKRGDKKRHTCQQSSNVTPSVNPRMHENTSARTKDDIETSREQHTSHPVPSAPPIELLDEDFIRFLENALNEEDGECPNLDETPAADYTILLEDTWEDDLQPDYDVTLETIEADILNNLNKEELKTPGEKLLHREHKTESRPVHLNIMASQRRTGASHQKDVSRHNRTYEKNIRHVTANVQKVYHDRTQEALGNEAEKGETPTSLEAARTAKPLPGSREYSAWITWRKQVNRQLATVILLRRGGHVKLQQGDLSRKHLNRRSVDFVSNIFKSDNQTSLDGKPFVMYGIPRACLSPSNAH